MKKNIIKSKQTRVSMNRKLIDCTNNMYGIVRPKANIINPYWKF